MYFFNKNEIKLSLKSVLFIIIILITILIIVNVGNISATSLPYKRLLEEIYCILRVIFEVNPLQTANRLVTVDRKHKFLLDLSALSKISLIKGEVDSLI